MPSDTSDFCKIGSRKAVLLQVSKTSIVEQHHLFMNRKLTAITFVKKKLYNQYILDFLCNLSKLAWKPSKFYKNSKENITNF